MSQEKVDRYKATKNNRKAENKKKKTIKIVRIIASLVILAAIIFWLSFSAYKKNEANKPRESVNADITSIVDYVNGLVE